MILQPGTKLGPYEVLDRLGVGGMGEVYLARDSRLDRTIAIKVVSPTLASDQEFRLRFEREARLAAALDHPHICTIFDVGQEHDVAYLVMQNVRGETLAARLTRGPLPLDAALEYGIQIASALAAAHSAGILHRDLKPANVMITDGSVKILDFGLAKSTAPTRGEASAETGATGSPLATLTRGGFMLGTPASMSPEQVEGRHVEPQAPLELYDLARDETSNVAAPIPSGRHNRVVPRERPHRAAPTRHRQLRVSNAEYPITLAARSSQLAVRE